MSNILRTWLPQVTRSAARTSSARFPNLDLGPILTFRNVVLSQNAARALSTTSPLLRDENFKSYGGRNRYESPARRPRESERVAPHPSKTLFLGNLPYSIEEGEIREMFETFGELQAIRIGTDAIGRTRGFAHVEFVDQNHATRAKDHCDEEGAYIQRRELRVDYAPTIISRDKKSSPSHKLYVNGFRGDETDLQDVFQNFSSSLVDVFLFKDPQTREPNGAGFINFTSVEEATEALNALKGELKLEYARPPRQKREEDASSGRGYRYGLADRDDSNSVSSHQSGRQFGKGSSKSN